jgi:hypothetical protein
MDVPARGPEVVDAMAALVQRDADEQGPEVLPAVQAELPRGATVKETLEPTGASLFAKNNMAGFAAVCSGSSWPWPKTTALSRSS